MKNTPHQSKKIHNLPSGRPGQQGVILFIAMVALVILSFAGIAFMRMVDTASILAGNLAFNRAAVAISDAGMEAGRAQLIALDSIAVSGQCGLTEKTARCLWKNGSDMTGANAPLTGAPPTAGYFAWADPAFNPRTHDWDNAYQYDNTSFGWTTAQQTAAAGFDVRYVIHRMCELAWTGALASQTGNPAISNCLTTANSGGKSQGAISVSNNQAGVTSSSALYRITIRVTGPRNSVSYIQVWTS